MLICSYTFRWSYFKTREHADLTARWFATWIRLNNDNLTYSTSDDGPVVTISPRQQYDDFVQSLRDRALAGERLSVVVPPSLQSAAAAGQLPEEVAPVKNDEGFLLDPSEIDWDKIDTSAWDSTPVPRKPPSPAWQPQPSAIVDRIIAYAGSHPNGIPFHVLQEKELLTALRNCNMTKKFLEKTQAFFQRVIFGSWPALATILPYVLLSIRLSDGSKAYWNGTGFFFTCVSPIPLLANYDVCRPDTSDLVELEVDRLINDLQPFLQPIC